MTERENGTPSASGAVGAGDPKEEGPGATPARAAPAQTLTKSRRRTSGSQQFVANVFQDVSGALDPDFTWKDGIFVFDAEDALVADVHVRLNDGLPEAGAVAVADGAE